MFTLAECFYGEGEVEKAEEDYVEFLEVGEDAAEALEPAEEPFDLVALLNRARGRTPMDGYGWIWVAPLGSCPG